MTRNTLLAVAFLLAFAGLWGGVHLNPSVEIGVPARFVADAFPAPPALPESLPKSASVQKPLPRLALALPAILAVLLLLWRRRMGQRLLPALLPPVVVLLHPATETAVRTMAGLGDLGALSALAFGAILLTAASSTLVGAGFVLLFLSVLIAPSGAALSAVAAFVLLERKPTMIKGAALLLVYGLARANGLLLLDAVIAVPPGYHGVSGVPLYAFLDGLIAAAASVVPHHALLLVPAGGEVTQGVLYTGLAVLGAFALGVTLLPPERRFGGRFTPALGFAAVVLIAAQATWTASLPACAALIVAILVAQWAGSAADDVDRKRPRTIAAAAVGLVLLVAVGGSAWMLRPEFRSHSAYLESLGASLGAAEDHPVTIGATRAWTLAASADELEAEISRRLEVIRAEPSSANELSSIQDHDLAVAAAIQGSFAPAADLLELAMPAAPAASRDAFALDLADIYLRQYRAGDAISLTESVRARNDDPKVVAQALAREAIGYATRGLRLSADATADARDREMAQAWSRLDQAIEADRDCARALLDRGRLRLAHDQGTGALMDLEACSQLRPDLAEPCLELAKLYFVRDLPEEGEIWLTRAQQIAGLSDPDVKLLTARLMLFRGDPVGAMSMAEELQPVADQLRGGEADLAELYRVLARLAEEQESQEIIEPMCRLALFYGSDGGGESTDRLYRFLKDAQRWEEAWQHLNDSEDRGIPIEEFDRKLALVTKNAGYARHITGDKQRALEFWMETLRRSPDCRDLGAVPAMARSIADTVESADLSELGDLGFAAYERAKKYKDDERLHDAARCFRTSSQLVPGMPNSHFGLAQVLDELGQLDEATAAWKACGKVTKAMLARYREAGDVKGTEQMERMLQVVYRKIGLPEESGP